jgi:hypothetical protein
MPRRCRGAGPAHGVQRWGTDLDAALANPDDTVFFDAGTTQMRPHAAGQGHRAGKHVYCEKPIATNLAEALEIAGWPGQQGPQARRGAGQAVPAGPAQAGHAAPRRLLRPHAVACASSSATGCSRATCSPSSARAGTTARRRRRHDPGHDVPLALRAGQPVRRGASPSPAWAPPTSRKRWDEAGQPYAATADDAAYATAS